MTYSDRDVPIECANCSEIVEGIFPMVNHLLAKHSDEYDQKEAENFAQIWADDAYEEIEVLNLANSKEFGGSGIDPDSI